MSNQQMTIKEFMRRGIKAQKAIDEILPLSHQRDPQTSYDAADKMVKSGALSRQEQKVWEAIAKMSVSLDNFTAKDLFVCSTISYYTIQRRLSGLRNKGKIERTSEKRNGCCVWEIIERR